MIIKGIGPYKDKCSNCKPTWSNKSMKIPKLTCDCNNNTTIVEKSIDRYTDRCLTTLYKNKKCNSCLKYEEEELKCMLENTKSA